MSRDYYNKVAAEWKTALDAVRAAGSDTITLPVSHLAVIFIGYEQHQHERAATLDWISEAEQRGDITAAAAVDLRHKLGDLTDDQHYEQLRAIERRQP